jgi:hypothetical protein
MIVTAIITRGNEIKRRKTKVNKGGSSLLSAFLKALGGSCVARGAVGQKHFQFFRGTQFESKI